MAKAEKEADRAALRENIDKVKKKADSWAACLARVFEVYPLTCPKCGLEMAVCWPEALETAPPEE